MAWGIGVCQRCHYQVPDRYGASLYCVFKVRHRRFSITRMRYIREWIWICDDCDSQTAQQARRNRAKD